MLAQGLIGVRGVNLDEAGQVEVDPSVIDPEVPVTIDLDHDAFVSLRTFLDAARGRRGPVKWQLTGPVTLGLSLSRRGVACRTAFDTALGAVREHLRVVQRAVAEALPDCPQVVFLDEPGLATLLRPGFPLAAETALDLVSGALAAIEPSAMGGVHHCGEGDEVAILASGPAILSMPIRPGLVDVAGHLERYLDRGGWIAWGAVPTDRPVGPNADRPWRELADLWCALVQAGCKAERLRSQAVITPACGLGLHGEDQARAVLGLVADVAGRVRAQALATRLSIGA
jgi:methionine synthase II (cobalamin-independent)